MRYSLIACKDPGEWDDFVAQSPQGNVFCESFFLESQGKKYERFFLCDGGSPRMAVPLVLEAEGRLHSQAFPLSLYQGPLFSREVEASPVHSRVAEKLKLWEFLLNELEASFSRLSFCLHHRHEDLRALQWFHYHEPDKGGFSLKLHYTGLIECEDGYLNHVRKSRRSEKKKAEVGRLEIRTSTDISALLELYQLTFARQGKDLSSESLHLVERVSRNALSLGRGELFFCSSAEGQLLSANLFLFDHHTAYYLVGANQPEYRNSGAGTYLLLENIQRAHNEGRVVDVCGMNSPARGDFKTSFNARPVPYFVTDWSKAT